MTNNWVGHSLIKPIDVNELFNRNFIIHKLGSSLNDDESIIASVVAEGETEEAVFAEVV